MTAASIRSAPPSEVSETGPYLESDAHYACLARHIGRQLSAATGNVLVTGAPDRDGDRLLAALRRENGPAFRLAQLDCADGLAFPDVIAALGRTLGLPAQGGLQSWTVVSRLMLEARSGTKVVLLLANPESLGDAVFDEVVTITRVDDPAPLSLLL